MTFVTFWMIVANQNLWWYIVAIYEIQHPTHVRPSPDIAITPHYKKLALSKHWSFTSYMYMWSHIMHLLWILATKIC